jgi:hypothetical protein
MVTRRGIKLPGWQHSIFWMSRSFTSVWRITRKSEVPENEMHKTVEPSRTNLDKYAGKLERVPAYGQSENRK